MLSSCVLANSRLRDKEYAYKGFADSVQLTHVESICRNFEDCDVN